MESPLINGTIVSFSLIHVSRCNAKMPRQPFIQASAQNARGAGLVFANVGGSVVCCTVLAPVWCCTVSVLYFIPSSASGAGRAGGFTVGRAALLGSCG